MNDQASIFQFSGWWSWPRGRIHWLFYTKWMIMLPFLISPFNKKSNVWKVTTSHFWEKILTLKFLSLVFSPYLCSQLPTALLVASGLCGTVHGPAAGGFFLMFCWLSFFLLLPFTSLYFSLLLFRRYTVCSGKTNLPAKKPQLDLALCLLLWCRFEVGEEDDVVISQLYKIK